MAYNLNYNPGTEYDKRLRHRRILIILVAILILIVLGVLTWVGFKNSQKIENEPNVSTETNSQKEQIIKALQAPPTHELTPMQKQQITKDLQAAPPKEQQLTEAQMAKIRADLMK